MEEIGIFGEKSGNFFADSKFSKMEENAVFGAENGYIISTHSKICIFLASLWPVLFQNFKVW